MAQAPSSPKSSNRRDEILAVAARVIAERGIKDATVRDIGEAAGILSGSLYHHFSSKDQIVLELLLPSVRDNHEKAKQICAESTGIEAVAALIRMSILDTAENPHRSVILRNEARLFAELASLSDIAEVRADIIDLWMSAVRSAIDAGEVRPDIEPDIIVRAILDGTLGASRWFNGAREADPTTVVDSLVDFYVAGLRQP